MIWLGTDRESFKQQCNRTQCKKMTIFTCCHDSSNFWSFSGLFSAFSKIHGRKCYMILPKTWVSSRVKTCLLWTERATKSILFHCISDTQWGLKDFLELRGFKYFLQDLAPDSGFPPLQKRFWENLKFFGEYTFLYLLPFYLFFHLTVT